MSHSYFCNILLHSSALFSVGGDFMGFNTSKQGPVGDIFEVAYHVWHLPILSHPSAGELLLGVKHLALLAETRTH